MSQFGMQMPGGRAKKGGGVDLYTSLAFVALVFLAAGCVAMYFAAGKVSPTPGNPFELQKTGPMQVKVQAPGKK